MEVKKKLGFGLMRLPKIDDEIDLEETKKMVDLFLEAGFNYFDTARIYKGSEAATKKVLVDRYPRESFLLATKNAAWADCKTKEEAEHQFDESLKQTGAGYFDYYLLHNLGEDRTEYFDRFDLWDWAFNLKKKGKVKHVGFSFHSTPEELEDLLTKHPDVDFIQLQINYADWDDPVIQSRACYEVARKHHKPVIVMEPVKGGMLANPPLGVKKIFEKENKDASPASWAIKFAADLDGVLVVLSGMSNLDQMKDNISYMKEFEHLTASEKKVIEKAQKELKKTPTIPCTNCNYCAKVCPQNIGISASFQALNILLKYDDLEKAKGHEDWHVRKMDKARASECIKCGACEKVCPQHIKIRDELENVCKKLL